MLVIGLPGGWNEHTQDEQQEGEGEQIDGSLDLNRGEKGRDSREGEQGDDNVVHDSPCWWLPFQELDGAFRHGLFGVTFGHEIAVREAAFFPKITIRTRIA